VKESWFDAYHTPMHKGKMELILVSMLQRSLLQF